MFLSALLNCVLWFKLSITFSNVLKQKKGVTAGILIQEGAYVAAYLTPLQTACTV